MNVCLFDVVEDAGGLTVGIKTVPYYQGEAALQIFDRTLRGKAVADGL